jgi:iron complex outermembrane receptor protein
VSASGQDIESLYSRFDTLALDEIVVTATKTVRNLTEVPSRITVIGSGIIQNSPTRLVDDLLRFTAGVNVDRASGIYSSNPSVTLRGLSGDEQSRTLVLLNGIPINASDGGSVNWNKINQYDVERIEVFKGPGSSLYGNNAMGGVINIITKTPNKPQEVFASLSYGTYNTVRQDLAMRMRSEKGFYASLAQSYTKSDGYMSIPEENQTENDINLFYEGVDVSAKVGHDKNQWLKWELQYDIYRDVRGLGTRYYIPLGMHRKFDTDLLRGVLKGGNGNTKYDLNVYYQMVNYNHMNERVRGGAYERYDVDSYRKDWGALFNITHQLTDNNTLTGGLEYKNGGIKGGDYYQTAPYDTVYNAGIMQTYAAYLQDEHAFFDNKIRLVAGVRFDNVAFSNGEYYSTAPWGTPPELEDRSWSHFSPKAGLRFNFIKELSAYISYSHGFRASILDDLTRTGYMWVGPKYANPDLGPESLNNYEVGADLFLSTKFKFSTSLYYAKGNDFMYYVNSGDELSPGRPIFKRENVTGVTMSGVETEFNYSPLNNLRFTAAYAYSNSTIDKFDLRPDLEDKYLTYVPKHRASASLSWQNNIADIHLRGLYKSKQFSTDDNTGIIDAYSTFDLQLSRRLTSYMSAMLDIQDVFDNQHMETDTRISPGRLISLRLSLNF